MRGGLIGRLVRIFGERALARAGLFVTALSLALLPVCSNLIWLLVACLGLSLGSGFASPPLNGLASQLVDQSWQGRALGVLQSAGSTARLLGPLLGGWLLMFDLHKPFSQYGRTPFFAASLLCNRRPIARPKTFQSAQPFRSGLTLRKLAREPLGEQW